MEKKQKYQPPTQDISDVGHLVASAAISAIPWIGGPGIEIFKYVVGPPIEKRRTQWMEEVGNAIRYLEEKGENSIDKLVSNDVFIDTLIQASTVALRTSQIDKINALRNAVINSAAPNPINQTYQQLFLAWIDVFTVWHICVLKLFQDPLEWSKVNDHSFSSSAHQGLDLMLEDAFPELGKDRALYDQIWKDLLQNGLINTPSLHGMMTSNGVVAKRTTELGNKFLRYICQH